MKLNYQALYTVCKQQQLSNREACFVVRKVFPHFGVEPDLGYGAGPAAEYIARHGENGNADAQRVLSKLTSWTLPQLERYLDLAMEYQVAREELIRAELAKEEKVRALQDFIAAPMSQQEFETAEQEAISTWWNEEGRFEEELEESGEAKYYYYERDRMAKNGVELSPREYLDGGYDE